MSLLGMDEAVVRQIFQFKSFFVLCFCQAISYQISTFYYLGDRNFLLSVYSWVALVLKIYLCDRGGDCARRGGEWLCKGVRDLEKEIFGYQVRNSDGRKKKKKCS